MNRVPRWRLVAAAAVLAALAIVAAAFAPIYFRNLKLQSFVLAVPQRAAGQATAPSDETVRGWVIDESRRLGAPVTPGGVRILRSADGRIERVEVRYFVRMDLPGYTVNLHFYPGVGSQ